MSHHVIRASAQKHGSFLQEGEGLCGFTVSLETSHTGGGGHWPHPHLPRHRARAEHGGVGRKREAAHWSCVAAQGLIEREKNSECIIWSSSSFSCSLIIIIIIILSKKPYSAKELKLKINISVSIDHTPFCRHMFSLVPIFHTSVIFMVQFFFSCRSLVELIMYF